MRARHLGWLLWLSTAFGCAKAGDASTGTMTQLKKPRPIAAKADAATVVFVRWSKQASGVAANIADEQGRFVGDLATPGHFAVQLAPGHHKLVVWAENNDGLAADLAAGKVYYVEIEVEPGALSALIKLKAIKPSRPSWSDRESWLAKTPQFEVDQKAGQARLKHDASLKERIQKGLDALAKAEGEHLDARTLAAADGL